MAVKLLLQRRGALLRVQVPSALVGQPLVDILQLALGRPRFVQRVLKLYFKPMNFVLFEDFRLGVLQRVLVQRRQLLAILVLEEFLTPQEFLKLLHLR